ncbi:hypothetical protein LAZ67_9003519 [Cordylochernes scorpioides]|uniref:Reverse transcriptase domain-containing protein n=1 Tax=Cordylochernes scorpioides TaxID=51811 RepID=A0ABY6KW64_9ARAC|nr:hypothetical protein LAZ67_9003519 [Cordylochernes scorpioides]
MGGLACDAKSGFQRWQCQQFCLRSLVRSIPLCCPIVNSTSSSSCRNWEVGFRDDTAILAQAKTFEELEIQLNKDLETLHNYFENWSLRLNPAKSVPHTGGLQHHTADLQGYWLFGQGLDENTILASAKSSIHRFFLSLEMRGERVVNPTPPIEQFLAQRGFWERGDELQYASLEHPTHALLDSGPEIWLANPSFEYSHSGDIH